MLDDILAQAYGAAKTSALALLVLASRLSLPADAATALRDQANLIGIVLAPQLEVTGTAAQIGAAVTGQAIAAGTAMAAISGGPRDAAPVFYDVATYIAGGLPPTASPAKRRSASLARALLACGEAAMLGQAFLMEAQSEFTDRQSAVDARARIAAAMDGASDRIAATAGPDIFSLLAEAARQASEYLVQEASELRPLVRVDATRSWPSTALAWALYGDPARAEELVGRNRVGTPLFMPVAVEALSPDAS